MEINQAYFDVKKLNVSIERNLMDADFLSGSRVVVVDEGLKDSLFEEEGSLLGKVVYIREQPVEIVGVIENESGGFEQTTDMVYAPMSTWQNIFQQNSVTELSIQSSSPDNLQLAGKKSAHLLNQVNETDRHIIV